MEDKKVMKNMEYWNKKNNIPGIEALEAAGLTDGRAKSSAFQMAKPGSSPNKGWLGGLFKGAKNIAKGVAGKGKMGFLNPGAWAARGIKNTFDKDPATTNIFGGGKGIGGIGNAAGGVGEEGGIEAKVAEKVDEKVDEKVEAAVSGDSAVAMKSPVKKKAGPETKQVDIDDLDGERQEASAQEFERIKNDHDVDDNGIPQTDPKGYWKKAAKHGVYPTDVREQ